MAGNSPVDLFRLSDPGNTVCNENIHDPQFELSSESAYNSSQVREEVIRTAPEGELDGNAQISPWHLQVRIQVKGSVKMILRPKIYIIVKNLKIPLLQL